MAYSYTFKQGKEQAQRANHYFQGIASEWIVDRSNELVPRQYILQESGWPDLHVRVWSTGHDGDSLRRMLPWIRRVQRKLGKLAAPGGDPRNILPGLLQSHVSHAWCFIEVLGRKFFTPDEEQVLTLGVENGRLVLLSSPTVMLIELQEGLLGLTVHERGSWLIEKKQAPVGEGCSLA